MLSTFSPIVSGNFQPNFTELSSSKASLAYHYNLERGLDAEDIGFLLKKETTTTTHLVVFSKYILYKLVYIYFWDLA